MDVRCEQCGTEYELDEARLKPGGVTVKCTSCGHMFKIRRRPSTNLGLAPVNTPPAAPRTPAARPASSSGVPRPHTQTGDSGPNDRTWIIRLTTGEQRTCRELATLQQWILAGEATRDAMISRSGKTWKQLGDIPELAQFFDLAEEARGARAARDSARVTAPQTPARGRPTTPDHKATLLGMPVVPGPRPPPTRPPPAPPTGGTTPPATLLGRPANDDSAPTPPRNPLPPPAALASTALSPMPHPGPGGPLARPGGDGPATGAWAAEEVRMMAGEGGREGPLGGRLRLTGQASAADSFGGQVRPVPVHDVAFASSAAAPPSFSMIGAAAAEPGSLVDDLDEATGPLPHRRGGGLGKWIAIASLALIAGAAAIIYATVIRQERPATADRPAALVDAGAVVVTGLDAGAELPLVPEPAGEDLLADATLALAADTAPALDAAAARLAEGAGADEPRRLALRARLVTARAQLLEDEAALAADARAAGALRKEARQRTVEALTVAQKAVKLAAGTPAEAAAQVAMADVLRLQGKPAKEVRRPLDRALALAPADREAQLVAALLAVRDGKAAEAKTALAALDRGPDALERSGDVRARFRLAMLALAGRDGATAQQAAEQVLAAQPEHAGARALLARVRDAVVTSDPMPPEERGGAGAGGSRDPAPPAPATESYDALLKKADQLAEVHCGQALPYYQRALAIKPNGVGALTGRGYCYLDRKEFASAHSSFRAALAVSSRYEPALWGMAELYQHQGLKDRAIEAYMRYLEVFPGTQKAIRQIERLGGAVDDGGGASGRRGGREAGGGDPGGDAPGGERPGSGGGGSAEPDPAGSDTDGE
jgi:predicted Zn finger-like uncharacterized protein